MKNVSKIFILSLLCISSTVYPMRRNFSHVIQTINGISYTCYGHTRNHTPIRNPLYSDLKNLCKESINSNPLLHEAFENVDYQGIQTITKNEAQQKIAKINDTQQKINDIIQKILETDTKS